MVVSVRSWKAERGHRGRALDHEGRALGLARYWRVSVADLGGEGVEGAEGASRSGCSDVSYEVRKMNQTS